MQDNLISKSLVYCIHKVPFDKGDKVFTGSGKLGVGIFGGENYSVYHHVAT